MRTNRNFLVIALIAMVNALGYGIIIPILYAYSQQYGLTDFQNGLLFALFSIFQFGSTPLIGRLSDKYGRRPLLLLSLFGTALSFFMAAFAPNALFLFMARALDGLTAGNFPVAAAVISDTTDIKDRAKGFAILGASFGFGFTFGPAISALTVQFGMNVPFIIAGVIALIAVLVTAIMLPETNQHMGQVQEGKLFDFKKLAHALYDEKVGTTLLITLFSSLSFGMFIFAFQPFSVKVLHMTATQISITFTLFGVIGLITQMLLLARVVKFLGEKRAFTAAFGVTVISYIVYFFTQSIGVYYALAIILGFANSFINPLTQTILSKETDAKSQGSIQGINASYMSIGQIFGPIFGGAIATIAIPYPFLAASVIALICFFLTFTVLKPGVKKESVF